MIIVEDIKDRDKNYGHTHAYKFFWTEILSVFILQRIKEYTVIKDSQKDTSCTRNLYRIIYKEVILTEYY